MPSNSMSNSQTNRRTLGASSAALPLPNYQAACDDNDSTGNVLSPLYKIIQGLKRKNSVTAAASTLSQHINLVETARSDPWGSIDEGLEAPIDDMSSTVFSLSATCICGASSRRINLPFADSGRRRPTWDVRYAQSKNSVGYSSPLRNGSTFLSGSVGWQSHCDTIILPCPACGKPSLELNDSSCTETNQKESGMIQNISSPRRMRMNQWLDSPRIARLEAPRHAQELLHTTPQLRIISAASTDMNVSETISNNILGLLLSHSSRPLNNSMRSRVQRISSKAATGIATWHENTGVPSDYDASLKRDEANGLAAQELASLLWMCAHEMTLEDYGMVETETFTKVFDLIHSLDNMDRRIAGMVALDALIDAPSADEEKKAIKFANTLSGSLRSAFGNFEFLSVISIAIGHMAKNNVDFVESEISRALEWLRTDRSDRRLAATLVLKEFALHAPTAFYSKTSQSTLGQGGSNEFLDTIFQALRDPQPIVRACAADALSQCLVILLDRQHSSLTGLLCQVHFSVMEGLVGERPKSNGWAVAPSGKIEASQHGSLLVIATMIAQTGNFMLPRFDEVSRQVMECMSHPKTLIKLEVVRLLPRLARRCPKFFARRYLEMSLSFLLECASTAPSPRNGVDLRPSSYVSIGLLVLAMVDHDSGEVIGGANLPTLRISEIPEGLAESFSIELCDSGAIHGKLDELFALVREGLNVRITSSRKSCEAMHVAAFHCAADLVEALGEISHPYITDLVNDMFGAGLSNDLIHCLHAISECVPEQQSIIEDRLFQEISVCLAGNRWARDLCDPIRISQCRNGAALIHRQVVDPDVSSKKHDSSPSQNEYITGSSIIRINYSASKTTIQSIILSLQTLGSFGDTTGRLKTFDSVLPLLRFVEKVAAPYLSHPSSEVRKAAALTCCGLLIPFGTLPKKVVRSWSANVVEDILGTLLRVAVSDPTSGVRSCIVQSLDARYHPFLCPAHHLTSLFLLLQDDSLATRAAGLRLLGRLASFNPAPILPLMRKFLYQIQIELQCGIDSGRGKEEATKMLVVFLKANSFHRLIHPVLPKIVGLLPLKGGTPRLASAALEALGELSKAAGVGLQPWVKEVVPNILETLQDQSSASKQRTSLRTLSQIAGSTGYVIQPYLDYPRLLSQAIDILPGTKRAPWSLRREVIRTLGVLGALDPDRYRAVAPQGRKGGAVGGAYFVVQDDSNSVRTGYKSASVDATGTSGVPAMNFEVNSGNSGIGSCRPPVSRSRHVASPPNDKQPPFTCLDGGPQESESDDDKPAYLSMYEQYAMVAQPASSHTPARRMTPADDEFYPTVAIQALMRIFRDQSLAVHHGMVMQAIMFIFKSLGLRCVSFLGQVVPYIVSTIRTCGPSNLRDSLLKQIATLSEIVREHLRPYVSDIFDIVEQFWSSRHLSTLFILLNHIAVGVPDEFRVFVPRLIRLYLSSLDEIQISEITSFELPMYRRHALTEKDRLRLILRSLRSLKKVLKDYLHILVPVLLRLADSLLPHRSDALLVKGVTGVDQDLVELCVLTLQTVSSLLECEGATDYTYKNSTPYWGQHNNHSSSVSARAIQPLVLLLHSKCKYEADIGLSVIETICVCATQIGLSVWTRNYNQIIRQNIEEWENRFGYDLLTPRGAEGQKRQSRSGLELYDATIFDLQHSPMQRSYLNPRSVERGTIHRLPLLYDSISLGGMDQTSLIENASNFDGVGDQTSRIKVNQAQLQRAWDSSQCASREDWDEWMRRLGIQLLREASSPSLRASAGLAHAYQPLSRELFSAAFVCCWKELSEPYRINLVHSLEAAFVADVSPEILQALLNLAEFMEHDPSGGLPIDIPTLANLALKCRAYAKALHYKEREYSMSGSNACVEALISINRKLDLQEAALGIIELATMRFEELMWSEDETVASRATTGLPKQQTSHGVFYSVVWSTDDRNDAGSDSVNFAENKERWLAKLGSWTDALEVYEEKLMRSPLDFDAILGCMRCSSSSGDWRRVLQLAEESWIAISEGGVNPSGLPETTVAPSREQKKALRMCAEASWRLGRWSDLEKYASTLVRGQKSAVVGGAGSQGTNSPRDASVPRVDFEGAFYLAVLHTYRKDWRMAAEAIDAARQAMDGRFTALMAESYSRAYPSMVTAQTLAELEEIIEFQKCEKGSQMNLHRLPDNTTDTTEARGRLLSVWRKRLAGCRFDADVHSSILAVRSLVLGPSDEVDATITLSELSREAQRYKLAERVLLDPLDELGADLNGSAFGFGVSETLGLRTKVGEDTSMQRVIENLVTNDSVTYLPTYEQRHYEWSKQLVNDAGGLGRLRIQHKLYFAFLKHLWLTERRQEALYRLSRLCDTVDLTTHCESVQDNSFRAQCWLELGEWQIEENISSDSVLPQKFQVQVLSDFKRAAVMSGCYKAWHNWALLNFRIAQQLNKSDEISAGKTTLNLTPLALTNHVVAAIKGFVRAISLGTKRWSASVQQDMLNFLTCLFQYGEQSAIAGSINECVETVPIETWLGVLPQLLARIHIKSPAIRSVLHPLLVRLGEKHPQALMYPLSVLLKSPVVERKSAAESLMNSLRSHSSELVEEALMVSSELIRVAILWLETWHEGLDEASRLYFGEGNVSGMLALLVPLHEQLEKGAETKRERDFISAFGPDLSKAFQHLKDYTRLVVDRGDSIPTRLHSNATDDSGLRNGQNGVAETAINKAWDIYYTVFRRVNKQLPALTKLELSDCSPALYNAHSLELGIPGSYRVDGSYVKIEKFIPSAQVITSKQRPRKITLRGSDGNDYVFLLKGHEDLRQDERVMQLFGLVNALLERDRQTKKHDLRIQRYAVSPLSHNCGLVGWVPHTDTLHSLIRDYRQTKRVPLNLEHREMLQIAPDYDQLSVMQKVEVFIDALKRTTGNGSDLHEILWLKSTNSEQWLERRTRYTRSLAVMSMTGYILGLGDRHPSNLMLDKLSGRVLHIDFGDCFEVAMMRDKFPERVPFRLTRMLIKAMEVSGIEGSYRSTCERTMSVLRESRDSLVAMLEAFLYDPLISWRLVDLSGTTGESCPSVDDPLSFACSRRSSLPPMRGVQQGIAAVDENHGVPIDMVGPIEVHTISERDEENSDREDDGANGDALTPSSTGEQIPSLPRRRRDIAVSASRARSLQMFSNIQTWAANTGTDERITSITGDDDSGRASVSRSVARSRMVERSIRQRAFFNLMQGDDGPATEVSLNKKAVKVIRRVQDKLNGTDFKDLEESGEPLAVISQVQRLIVQATSVENLSQLFIGWCAFW